MSIVNDVLSITDSILGLRDEFGAYKHKVYILKRTWPEKVGKDSFSEEIINIKPTPWLVDFSHSLRLSENGKYKQGDLMLKHISKQSYPLETDVDCSVNDSSKEEKFYCIDNKLYNVISVTSDYVYWNVQVRKSSKKKA